MNLHRRFAAIIAVGLFLGTLQPVAAAPQSARRTPVVVAVENARPAVVNIHSERLTRPPAIDENFGTTTPSNKANGMGTGIIIDPRGYIVTNYHVIEDISSLRVRLNDGSTYPGRVIERDKINDLALLKIDAEKSLPTIRIATSSDLMVGETVIAMGNAFGYEHTVTVGIISALHRDVTLNKEISYKSLIQTDASINPGNSGGPLLNINGELIGVNVAIRAGAQGIAFAIPVDQMVDVVTELLAKKRRTELFPGFNCRNHVQPEKAPERFVAIDRVDPTGPAAKAGIKNGDVLLQVGDVRVNTSIDVERAMLDRKVGDQIAVKIRRGDAEQQVALSLQPSPGSLPVTELAWKQLGVRLSPVGVDIVGRNNSGLRGGMLITEVNGNSPAAKAGLQRGDILVGLHLWETTSFDNVAYVLSHTDFATFFPLKFFVYRDGQIHKGTLAAE